MVRQNYVLSHVKPQATLPKPHTLMIRPPFNNHEQILIHTCSYTPHALSPISTKSTNHSLHIPRKASKIWAKAQEIVWQKAECFLLLNWHERVILWAMNTAQFFGKVSLQKGNCMKAYAHTVKMDDTCFLKSISCRYFLSVSL